MCPLFFHQHVVLSDLGLYVFQMIHVYLYQKRSNINMIVTIRASVT